MRPLHNETFVLLRGFQAADDRQRDDLRFYPETLLVHV